MGFLFTETFWGIFLILFGITIVLKAVFGINIPLIKTGFAILLIYAGVSMLTGGDRWFHKHNNTILFNESQVKVNRENQEYNIIFGSGMIDLSEIKPENGIKKVAINTIFGSGVLKINPDVPVIIKVDSVFANARFPDGTNISFGDYTYRSPQKEGSEGPVLEVEADVVFGSLNIIN